MYTHKDEKTKYQSLGGAPLSKTPALFEPRQEILNLVLPLVFFALLCVEWRVLGGFRTGNSWLIAFSFIAAIHHLLTIAIVGSSAPIRLRFHEISGGRIGLFLVGTVACLLTFFLLFAISLKNLRGYPYLVELFVFGFVIFTGFFVSIFHMIQQSKGISLLYNKCVNDGRELTARQTFVLNVSDRLERIAAVALVAAVSLGAICFAGPATKSRIFESAEDALLVGNISVGIGAIAAGMYIFAAFWGSRVAGGHKAVFSLRMAIWPFYPFSIAAQALVRVIHGAEYYFVYRKISAKRTYDSHFAAWAVLWFSVIAYAAVLAFRKGGVFHRFLGTNNFGTQIWGLELWEIAYAVYGSINLLHICFDSLIFRSSFQAARAGTVFPLSPSQPRPANSN